MSDDKRFEVTEATEVVKKTRRAVMVSAAQVAVTAPAVVLLLNASSVPASAQVVYGPGTSFGDDTTFSDNPANGNGDPYPSGPADDLRVGDDTSGTHPQ